MKKMALLLRFTVSLLALFSVSGCRLFMWENFTNDLIVVIGFENQTKEDLNITFSKDFATCSFTAADGEWTTLDMILYQKARYRDPIKVLKDNLRGMDLVQIKDTAGNVLYDWKEGDDPKLNIFADPSRYELSNIPYARDCPEITSWYWFDESGIGPLESSMDMKKLLKNGIEKYTFSLIYSDLHNFKRGF